jgi:hypothetical protein
MGGALLAIEQLVSQLIFDHHASAPGKRRFRQQRRGGVGGLARKSNQLLSVQHRRPPTVRARFPRSHADFLVRASCRTLRVQCTNAMRNRDPIAPDPSYFGRIAIHTSTSGRSHADGRRSGTRRTAGRLRAVIGGTRWDQGCDPEGLAVPDHQHSKAIAAIDGTAPTAAITCDLQNGG